jgi:hypothetical protein
MTQIGLCIFHRTTYHTIKQWKEKNPTKSKEQRTHSSITKHNVVGESISNTIIKHVM